MNHPSRRVTAGFLFTILCGLTGLTGCEDLEPPAAPVATAPPVAAAVDGPPVMSAAELRRRLGTDERATFRRVGTEIVEVYLAGTGVQSIEELAGLNLKVLDLGFCSSINDLSALRGMPLKTLILEGTSVADLSPIAGMQLEILHLQDTPVTDLTPIHGMPLKQLNLKGVAVRDVIPFAGMPLSTLWLLETDVSDISPLSSLRLESLDLQDTAVADLSALAHMTSLRRLNIAGTPVTDLRPVAGLRLDRIFLSPERITHGLEELRNIVSLGTIGTSHDNQFSAADFWERYDVGAWQRDEKKTDKSPLPDSSDTAEADARQPADPVSESSPSDADSSASNTDAADDFDTSGNDGTRSDDD